MSPGSPAPGKDKSPCEWTYSRRAAHGIRYPPSHSHRRQGIEDERTIGVAS